MCRIRPLSSDPESARRLVGRFPDPRRLALLLRAGQLTAVRVPSPTEEAVRDLCRARRNWHKTNLLFPRRAGGQRCVADAKVEKFHHPGEMNLVITDLDEVWRLTRVVK